MATTSESLGKCEICGAALSKCQIFCDAHGADHECGEERMLPVVNSPRMGVCGYIGYD